MLVEPDIPWNTGNVGRTCLGWGAELHLVGKLGFSLEDRYLKRAGLDYWPSVKLFVHPDAGEFFRDFPPGNAFFLSARAKKPFWRARIRPGAALVFGSETQGLPTSLRKRFRSRFYRIPFTGPIRSFNLSTAAGMVLGEAVRQNSR
ncbi:MAG TPA: tRNA (cytidine(34)-2'-O)-methyltransferase [Elusimicrobiota bacterium]|nr:tRNA (cytidine(34)-2'-O)-methyltransferase [Elusimicrobiota bacterium]